MSSDNINDKSEQTASGEDAVRREDMGRAIAQVSRQYNVSSDVAWDALKSQIQTFINTGKINLNWSGSAGAGQGSSGDFFDDEPQITDVSFTELSNADAIIDNSADNDVATPGKQTAESSDFILSDDLLPENLRGTISVMDAITRGLIKHPDEHPDAELLRAALAESGGIFQPNGNLDDKPAIRAIRDRQLTFPFKHPASVRIMPSDFNQTSLFHVASNNTPRRHYKNELMGKIGQHVSLYFQGEELRHDDEANFLQLLHLARGKAPYEYILADNVPFIRGSRGAKRILGVKDSDSVDESLMRMRGAFVVIRNEKRKGSFITVNLVKDLQGSGSQRRIMIDPCIVALLDSYTAMDQEILYKLKGVAKQLFKYISTKPYSGLYPIKVINLFEMCYGTQQSNIAHYKQRNPTKTDAEVKVAMGKKISDFRRKSLPDALQELKALELIVDYTINEKEDKVAMVKTPTNVEHIT